MCSGLMCRNAEVSNRQYSPSCTASGNSCQSWNSLPLNWSSKKPALDCSAVTTYTATFASTSATVR